MKQIKEMDYKNYAIKKLITDFDLRHFDKNEKLKKEYEEIKNDNRRIQKI